MEDIEQYQLVILKEMKFKIQWPTLETWGNYLTYKWDIFTTKFDNQNKMNSDVNIINNSNCIIQRCLFPKFRDDCQMGCSLLLNFFLVLDAISLDYYYMMFHEKHLCLCIIFLLVGIAMDIFNIEIIVNLFREMEFDSNYINYHSMFLNYIGNEYNVQEEKFRETLEYVAQFFNIIFDYSESPKKDTAMVSYIVYNNLFNVI